MRIRYDDSSMKGCVKVSNEIYRVIEIMDNYRLIINYGLADGAEKGDKVRIFEIGEEVIDPFDNSVLGTLDIIKAELKVTQVYENLSVCENIYTKTISILDPLASLARSSSANLELNVEKSQISGRTMPTDVPIKVGDKAIILT